MFTKLLNYTVKLSLLCLLIFLCIGGTAFASVGESSEQIALASCEPVVIGKIYRFIDENKPDSCVVPMDSLEIQRKLNDPFATALLRRGIFPDSAQAISEAIRASDLDFSQTNYIVGEGSQVPLEVASRDQPRNLRYVVSWGKNQNDAQILLSMAAPASQSGFHQIISWDDQSKAFNYYELRSQRNTNNSPPFVWSWAGNSLLARQPQTMGHGCFDCHHNGVPIMKELRIPWNNWHSQRVQISPNLVPVSVANEIFFQQRSGAEILEGAIQSNFQKYYREWLRSRYLREGSDIKLKDVNEMLSHVITNTTVNLNSVNIQSNGRNTSPPNRNINGISPIDTFLWDSILQTRLGLNYQSLAVEFDRDAYDQYLINHKFALVQRRDNRELYKENGSTYFSYFVPQVAAEDTYMTQQLLNSNILTNKFVASVAMVDFKEPLFSEKRARLQKYANEMSEGAISNGVSSVPDDFAKKVEAVASPCSDEASFDSCTGEEQFLYLWNLPDDQWKTLIANQLQTYVNTVSTLEPTEQLNHLMEISVQQRNRFVSTPLICNLFEFNLLIPETDFGDLPDCPKP